MKQSYMQALRKVHTKTATSDHPFMAQTADVGLSLEQKSDD
jgi:hypothetical protein